MRLFTIFVWGLLSYGMLSEASIIKINRDDTYIVDESGDVSKMYPALDMKHLVKKDITDEQVNFLKDNPGNAVKTWYNLKQVHKIEIIEVGFNYYVKIHFSPYESYFTESFDCEKAARGFVKDMFSE